MRIFKDPESLVFLMWTLSSLVLPLKTTTMALSYWVTGWRCRVSMNVQKKQAGLKPYSELPANAGDIRDTGSIPGKISWRRKWQPTPVLLPRESSRTKESGRLQSMESQSRTQRKRLSMHESLVAVWPWVSYLISLSLIWFFYKRRIRTPTPNDGKH